MIKKTFTIKANTDGSVIVNDMPVFNKLESGVTKLIFDLPDMEGFAYLLARHDRKEFFAVPIIDNEILMGTTVTQYHGRWAFNVCIRTTDIHIDQNDTDVFMSDTFEGLVYDNVSDYHAPSTAEPNALKIGADCKYWYEKLRTMNDELQNELETASNAVEQLEICVDAAAGSAREAASSADDALASATAASESAATAEEFENKAHEWRDQAHRFADESFISSDVSRAKAKEAGEILEEVINVKDVAIREAIEAADRAATEAAEKATEHVVEEVSDTLQGYVDAAVIAEKNAEAHETNALGYANVAAACATTANAAQEEATNAANLAANKATEAREQAVIAGQYAAAAEASATEAARNPGATEVDYDANTNTLSIGRNGEEIDSTEIPIATDAASVTMNDSETTIKGGTVQAFNEAVDTDLKQLKDDLKKLKDDKANTSDVYTKTQMNGMISDAYSATTAYVVGDRCIYENALYECIANCTGKAPTSTTYWKKIKLADLGGGQMVLLWSNANPSGDFPSQTIALDLTKYSFIEITFRSGSTEKIKVDGTERSFSAQARGFDTDTNFNYWYIATRIIKASQNDVYFSGARCAIGNKNNNSVGAVVANGWMVPTEIYGIK